MVRKGKQPAKGGKVKKLDLPPQLSSDEGNAGDEGSEHDQSHPESNPESNQDAAAASVVVLPVTSQPEDVTTLMRTLGPRGRGPRLRGGKVAPYKEPKTSQPAEKPRGGGRGGRGRGRGRGRGAAAMKRGSTPSEADTTSDASAGSASSESESEQERPAKKSRKTASKKEAQLTLSAEQEEDAIQWYFHTEALWNNRRNEYRVATDKPALYDLKAQDFGCTGSRLKRWIESQRDRYVKLRRKTQKSGAGTREPTDKEKWLMDKFEFLNPVLQAPRRQATVSLLRRQAAQDDPPAAGTGDEGAGDAGAGAGDDHPPAAGEQQEQPPPAGAQVNPGMYCASNLFHFSMIMF